jgi:predicted Co/Zn/Cd cation transporter (cation efflux family)
VLAQLSGTLMRLGGWSLAAGVSVGYLVTALHAPRMDTVAAGYMTILGAAVFVGFFAAFLLATSRWAALRTQDEWGEKGG